MEKPYHIKGLDTINNISIEEILQWLNEKYWSLRIEKKERIWQIINGEQVVFTSDNWDMIDIFICAMGLGHLPVSFVDMSKS